MADNPTTPEPKRRWHQFRLRTVLIGVAVLSIPWAILLQIRAHEVRERPLPPEMERRLSEAMERMFSGGLSRGN